MDIVEYKKTLTGMIDEKAFALPDNVKPEAFKNAAVIAFQDNPKVSNCNPASVFKSLRNLAAMGLVPDGREAALVPFKVKGQDICQEMPMVFGLIKMAKNSAEISDIRAHIVYENEIEQGRFEYILGDEETLVHRPIIIGDKGAPVAAYAIATQKDGSKIRAFMDADEIDQVRRSGASQRVFENGKYKGVSETPIGIWADWSGEMWRKTVIRRLSKRLPLSSDDQRRIAASEGDEFPQMKDVSPRPSLAEHLDQSPVVEPEDVSQDPEDAKEDVVEDAETVEGITPMPQNGFPGDESFDEGVKAFKSGEKYEANPYVEKADQSNADSWAAGWSEAHDNADREKRKGPAGGGS